VGAEGGAGAAGSGEDSDASVGSGLGEGGRVGAEVGEGAVVSGKNSVDASYEGVSKPPQAVARSTTVISNPSQSASRRLGAVLCSISTTYPLHETSACSLPAVHRFRPCCKCTHDTSPVLSQAEGPVLRRTGGSTSRDLGPGGRDMEFGGQKGCAQVTGKDCEWYTTGGHITHFSSLHVETWNVLLKRSVLVFLSWIAYRCLLPCPRSCKRPVSRGCHAGDGEHTVGTMSRLSLRLPNRLTMTPIPSGNSPRARESAVLRVTYRLPPQQG
jgi:hypothetical protein